MRQSLFTNLKPFQSTFLQTTNSMPNIIYAWGHDTQIAPFDTSSHLLAYLIEKYSLNDDYQIIPNSNIFKSYSGRLPMLQISETQQLIGFNEIWNFITSQNSIIQTNLSPRQKIIQIALINDVLKNLELVTLYNFFVNKRNYQGYTSPQFPKLLPWPTQYKAPIDLRKLAFEKCHNEGIIDDESNDGFKNSNDTDPDVHDDLQNLKNEEKLLHDTPVINDLQKAEIDKKLDIIAMKKSVISNMNCIKIIKSLIDKIHEFNDPLMKTIILVNLKCNIVEDLPENFIKIWLQREHQDLLKEIDQFNLKSISTQSTKVSLIDAIKSTVTNIF